MQNSPTAVYLVPLQANSGKSLVSLGLMEMLSSRVDQLGYFRPVVPDEACFRLELMRERYKLGDRAAFAYTDEEVAPMLADGRQDDVFKGVLQAYRDLAERCSFVVIEGTDQSGIRSALEFDFNAKLANHLAATVIAVTDGSGENAEEISEHARFAIEALEVEGVSTAMVMLNRVPTDLVDLVNELLVDTAVPVAVIRENPVLSMPTIADVAKALNATEVHSGKLSHNTEITSVKVAAMSLPNVLARLEPGELVIAPGDRPDVLIGVLASRLADTYPNIGGVLLSGGIAPHPETMRLLDGLGNNPTPIFRTDLDTYEAAREVSNVPATISINATRKIESALGTFEAHIDTKVLLDRIEVSRSTQVTPLMFEYDLIERARSDRKRIVLPEGTDERILRATALLRRRGVVDLVLLGDESKVRRKASNLGVNLDGVAILDPATAPERKRYAEAYVEARKHKGVVFDQADEVMQDVSYFGTMMVHLGDADGMVSGAAHTTAHTIRPAFEFVKTRPGVENVSSVFLMCLPDRVLVYGDCAVIPNPTPEQLADIAVSSAQTARLFDIDPAVAMLSYSTGESGTGEDVDTVRKATELVSLREPGLKVAGPIQYDAAVDRSVGQKKMPDSDVAGQATVFIFPDLNTGNNTYKAVQRSAGAVAIGPVLQGLNKPVNDLSRGCLVPDIVNTVAITAIQAQMVDTAANERS